MISTLTLLFCGALVPANESEAARRVYRAVADDNLPCLRVLLALHPRAANEPMMWARPFRTPVQFAAEHDRAGALALLLAHGGRVDGDRWPPPLHCALWHNSHRAVEVLLTHGAKPDVFALAALGRTDVLKPLLELAERFGANRALANARAPDPRGGTSALLHWAIRGGHRETVELLLAHGATVRGPAVQTAAWHDAPLLVAAECDRADLVARLVALGAPLEERDVVGHTPLHRAAECGAETSVAVLLRAGAKPDTRQNRQSVWDPERPSLNTPLHSAAQNGHARVLELLLAYGADPNARDRHGKTPLDSVRDWQPSARTCFALLFRYGARTRAKRE